MGVMGNRHGKIHALWGAAVRTAHISTPLSRSAPHGASRRRTWTTYRSAALPRPGHALGSTPAMRSGRRPRVGRPARDSRAQSTHQHVLLRDQVGDLEVRAGRAALGRPVNDGVDELEAIHAGDAQLAVVLAIQVLHLALELRGAGPVAVAARHPSEPTRDARDRITVGTRLAPARR